MKIVKNIALIFGISLLLSLLVVLWRSNQKNVYINKADIRQSETKHSKSNLPKDDARDVTSQTEPQLTERENINKIPFNGIQREDKYLFSGNKTSVLIRDWELIKKGSGKEVLKIPFIFTNKTDEDIILNDYIQGRIVVQQMLSFKDSEPIYLKINDLPKKVTVRAHRKYAETLIIPLTKKAKVGFAFGVRYVKNGDFGSLQVIHDLKNDPKEF